MRLAPLIFMGFWLLSDEAIARQVDPLRFAIIKDVPSTAAAEALLRSAYRQLGVEITTHRLPSRRALMMADRGQLDGDLFRIDVAAEQAPNLVRVPYPLLQGRLLAMTNLSGVRHLKELHTWPNQPFTVVVRRGVLVAERAAEALGGKIVRSDSYRQMTNLLAKGRAQLALVSDVEGISPLAGACWQAFTPLSDLVIPFTLYHYLNRRHAQLVEPLAAVLEGMDASGVRAQILAPFKMQALATPVSGVAGVVEKCH